MRYRFLIILIIASIPGMAQHTLSGYVFDDDSKEGLIGVTIQDVYSGKGVITNVFGFYSFTTESDSLFVRVSYVGYDTHEEVITLAGNLRKDFYLPTSTSVLGEVKVYADRDLIQEEVRSTQMGVFNLSPKEAITIPSIGGEADILKVAQLMPGITRGGEGTTAMYVRGGTDDQNLVTLDDATIYNLGHLFGFFSVFNTDALTDVTITKGGFPADYGGRLSAVMDTRMQEGNSQKIDGRGGIGLLTSRFTIDGPIVRDKATFMLAGRRTYIDRVLGLVGIPLPYFFYDLNAKSSVKITDRDRIYFSGYFGNDVLRIDEEGEAENDDLEPLTFGFQLGNFTSTIRWNHIYPDERLFSNITVLQTRFKYDIEGDFVDNSLLIRSQIQDFGIKGQWEYFKSPDERLDFGFDMIFHNFRPNVINTGGEISDFLRSRKGALLHTQEIALYAGKEHKITPKFTSYYGLRLSSSNVRGGFYMGVEPRLTASYELFDLTSVKSGYSLMRQYMHRVSSSSIVLPTDLWYPVTSEIRPQTSHQWSLGLFRGLPALNLTLSLEGYYKTMSNLIEYREGARLLLNDNFEKELVNGDGTSLGMEFLARRRSGKLTGWLSYTISKTDRQFPELNDGLSYPAKYDRRHDVSFVGMLPLSDRVEFSWVWVYTSGASFTPQTGQYLVTDATLNSVEIIPIYSKRNAVKLSPSHRLDLNFIIKSKKQRRFKGEWQFSIYNFYNRASPYQVSISSNGRAFQYVQPGIFGTLPSISYNFSF